MTYLKWGQITLDNFANDQLEDRYAHGFVFGRIGRGVMDETRSTRIDLQAFSLSSENRRILRKVANVTMTAHDIPYTPYDWTIGKLAKDFYDEKFGIGTFSANKIKEVLTDSAKSNFNRLFKYNLNSHTVGYAICLETEHIIHYSYPFYDLHPENYIYNPNIGMGMMLKAIEMAKDSGKSYIYLGSTQRPTDTYKLQFQRLEWWNGDKWTDDTEELKLLLTDDKSNV
jgi:arginyl-tRNA--protein-N-Asp/Glu arginylyltransferase